MKAESDFIFIITHQSTSQSILAIVRRLCFAFVLFFITVIVAQAVYANPILSVAAENFDSEEKQYVGIEIEFTGLSMEDASKIVQKHLGGKIQENRTPWTWEILDAETGVVRKQDFDYIENKVKRTQAGMIRFKPEGNNSTAYLDSDNVNKMIIELETERILVKDALKLQPALDEMKASGAVGTTPGQAVSLQISYEIGEGRREKMDPQFIVNLMRVYMKPVHRLQIESQLEIPEIRRPYIQPYSDGLMDRLDQDFYAPSLHQLFFDVLYRQTAEFLGFEGAWSKPVSEIRKIVMHHVVVENAFKNENSPIFRSIKFSPLKVASLLIFAFPEDPLSIEIIKSQWIKAIPALEVRDRNNDFNLRRALMETIGLFQMTKRLGNFTHIPAAGKPPIPSKNKIKRTKQVQMRECQKALLSF